MYMVPSALVVLDSLPLNPNGKLDRRALPAPEPERTEYEAPRSPLEQIVAQIWCDVLRLDKVGARRRCFGCHLAQRQVFNDRVGWDQLQPCALGQLSRLGGDRRHVCERGS